MKAFCRCVLLLIVTAVGLSQVLPAQSSGSPGLLKEKLVGAWHLARIYGPDGKAVPGSPQGMLIYTRDGHMSVQLMYPEEVHAQSNQYVKDGYEASFGSYTVDEAKHTVTHHVLGSVTRDLLVGRDLPRVFQFTDDHQLIIKSANPNEHWSVTWEHY
jgi:hypothetical protein